MRKVFAWVVLVLVAGLLVMPVFAASAHMSVSVSQGTVHRGDTITVTVSTSAVENCVSGRFLFSYNTDVFEYTGGIALVTGFGSAGVTDMGGSVSGDFMSLSGGTYVQGTLFQITLKIKENAPYGSDTISGTPSMVIENADGTKEDASCSAGTATVTVACNHSYGDVTKLDDNQHGKTCSNCGNVEKEDHAWGSDNVIKAATCKEGGQTEQTCSVCSATRIINTEPTEAHQYNGWTNANDTQHKNICSVCQKETFEDHDWKVTGTKQPDCRNEGATDYTCTGCGATKTEILSADPNAHHYGALVRVDENAHSKTCTLCGDVQQEAHAYQYTWSRDYTGHWHECAGCKDRIDVQAHTPGPAATETTPQLCTTCGYVIQAALGHTHNYASKWTTDEVGHWYACSGCEEKGSYADHDFENDCDPDCSVCGYTREIEHVFDEKWSADQQKHWHECSRCGVKQDEAAHEPGPEATATEAQVCLVCACELAPALGVEDTTAPAGTTAPTTADPDAAGAQGFLWAVVAVIAVAAAGVIVVMPKPKKQ